MKLLFLLFIVLLGGVLAADDTDDETLGSVSITLPGQAVAAKYSPSSVVALKEPEVKFSQLPLAQQITQAAASSEGFLALQRVLNLADHLALHDNLEELGRIRLMPDASPVVAYVRAHVATVLNKGERDNNYSLFAKILEGKGPDYVCIEAQYQMVKLWQVQEKPGTEEILKYSKAVFESGIAEQDKRVAMGFVYAGLFPQLHPGKAVGTELSRTFQQIIDWRSISKREHDRAIYLQTLAEKLFPTKGDKKNYVQQQLQRIQKSPYLNDHEKRNVQIWLSDSSCENCCWWWLFGCFCGDWCRSNPFEK